MRLRSTSRRMPPEIPVATPTIVHESGAMPRSQARTVPEAQKIPRPAASAMRKTSRAADVEKRFTMAGAKIVKKRITQITASWEIQQKGLRSRIRSRTVRPPKALVKATMNTPTGSTSRPCAARMPASAKASMPSMSKSSVDWASAAKTGSPIIVASRTVRGACGASDRGARSRRLSRRHGAAPARRP